jgi:hypothetical protein
MKRQHAGMLVHLKDLDRTLPAWRATATKEAAEPVRSALHGVSAALAEHFPDEEANIVPAMEHVLTQREEDWFPKHGSRNRPPIGIGGSKRYWEAGSPPVAKSGLGEIVPPN